MPLSTKNKIFILTNRIPYPLQDGGALAMDAMIRGYNDAGMKVYLLAMNTSRHPVPDEKLKTLYQSLHGFEWISVDTDVRAIKVLKNLLFSKEPEHAARFYHRSFEEKVVGILQQFQPDFIQIESLFLNSYLPAIHQHSKAKTILRLHNIEYQIWDRFAAKASVAKRVYLKNLAARMKRFEEKVWNEYDFLLPITATDAASVKKSNNAKPLLVAPFGIDASNGLTQPINAEPLKGYHLGAMDWMGNQEGIEWFLTDVWPAIQQQTPAFQFYFAGRNMPDRFYHALPQNVHCEGMVPDADAFIKDKQILIVPLRIGSGIRIKIFEAMAAGKLVISTDIGMQGIKAIPGQHYLSANTPNEFATNIKWCSDHPDEWNTIAENGSDLIKSNYDLATISGRIIKQLATL